MGFAAGYTEVLLPKLFLITLSALGFLHKLILSFLGLMGLSSFVDPGVEHDEPESGPLHTISSAGALIREMLPAATYADVLADCWPGEPGPPESCAVCLYEFEEEDEIRRMRNCRHMFHRCCVDRWIDHDRKTCPLCRKPFVPDELQEGAKNYPHLSYFPTLTGSHKSSPLTNKKMDPREEVIQAWYMDDSDEDQRLPHHKEPKEFVSLEKLDEIGVLSWRLDADNYETDEELKKIREARGYSYMDFCEVCPEKLPNYEEKIKNFFEEHLHTDEEIRYCVAGSGYFDVRDCDDKWIRVWVMKGAMIVLPAGIYHRFTLDSDNYIKAMRLFVGDPVWTPHNRPNDDLAARKEYVANLVNKGTSQAVDVAA